MQLSHRVFIGKLYAKERTKFESKLKSLLTRKTDRFFCVYLCKSCVEESTLPSPLVEKLTKQPLSFELVQAS